MFSKTEEKLKGEESDGGSYRAVVKNIVQKDGNGSNLKEPYVVTYSHSIKGSITFSLSLWKENYELSVGDEVLLMNVHPRRVYANSGGFRSGWRAEGVKMISPSAQGEESERIDAEAEI